MLLFLGMCIRPAGSHCWAGLVEPQSFAHPTVPSPDMGVSNNQWALIGTLNRAPKFRTPTKGPPQFIEAVTLASTLRAPWIPLGATEQPRSAHLSSSAGRVLRLAQGAR